MENQQKKIVPQIEKITVEYVQDADSNSSGVQSLTLSTSDAGGGIYYVMETERWAFDNLEEIIELLKDFQSRTLIQNP